MKPFRYEIWEQSCEQIDSQIISKVWSQVNHQVYNSIVLDIMIQVEDIKIQVGSQVRRLLREPY
jgi:hypothetical protein